MKHKSVPVLWMGIAFAVAFGLAVAVLAVHGTDTKSLVMAIRLTARWAFLLFWMAYAGGALAALFGPTLEPLAGRGREFGLAFAASMLVHLGLVAWLFEISARRPLSDRLIVFFLIGIFWTYLLAIFSFGGLSKALGSRGWRILRFVGLNYILFAFAFDFVPVAIRESVHAGVWRFIQYAPFATMSVAAPFLVLAAAIHRRPGVRFNFTSLGHRLLGRVHRYAGDTD